MEGEAGTGNNSFLGAYSGALEAASDAMYAGRYEYWQPNIVQAMQLIPVPAGIRLRPPICLPLQLGTTYAWEVRAV